MTIPGRYSKQPVDRVGSQYRGNLVGPILTEMDRELRRSRTSIDRLVQQSSPATAPTVEHRWAANGPFRVGATVDGGYVSPTNFSVAAVRLHRRTPGSSGSTIVDLNKNGVTMYTTQANRPTVDFSDPDNLVLAAQPDIATVAVGDLLTIDIDQIESGTPRDLAMMIEGM